MNTVAEAAVPSLAIDGVLAKSGSENFPVALRLVPPRQRQQLLALYGYARFVDDLGDLASGDRRAQLEWADAELDRALAGTATHPIFVAAGELARAVGIDRRPFADLIAANRLDQDVKRCPTYADLLQYCMLSANPVGRVVLAIFSADDDRTRPLSDDVCTGLQIVEHLQDVAEDCAAERVYLPLEDLERFAVTESELAAPTAAPALRRLIAFEAARARGLLDSGVVLVARLSGPARLAIASFAGGGLAQLDALESAGFDVLSAPVKATKVAVARRAAGVWRAAGRGHP